MAGFDPDAPAAPSSGLFGLDCAAADSKAHVLGVPFDATASFRRGAAGAPGAVLAASHQVELFDLDSGKPHERGIHMHAVDPRLATLNEEARRLVDTARAQGERAKSERERVNAIGVEVNHLVGTAVEAALNSQRLPAVLGGDHSVAFGAISAAARRHTGLGVLHFDAHADLRPAYEGFEWSHASVFHNLLGRSSDVAALVQVGVRDVSEGELSYIRSSRERVKTLFDRDWRDAGYAGIDRRALVREWIARLPDEVWISFDIDCLDPSLCPNTGTPVPGGLTWHDARLWLGEIARSNRRVVGVDLCEVNPGPTPCTSSDALVAARLLYALLGCALKSGERAVERGQTKTRQV
ncbi:MAG: arginase [Planctomycetes bacterium]|jgi:agmatinase|nr:arginase [Planctomycetota bacterium]MDP6407942.1 agmatinase family protein [Planctomycetota bacterium]